MKTLEEAAKAYRKAWKAKPDGTHGFLDRYDPIAKDACESKDIAKILTTLVAHSPFHLAAELMPEMVFNNMMEVFITGMVIGMEMEKREE